MYAAVHVYAHQTNIYLIYTLEQYEFHAKEAMLRYNDEYEFIRNKFIHLTPPQCRH